MKKASKTKKVEKKESSPEEKKLNLLVADVIDMFKQVNPTSYRLFGMVPQRKATERMLKKFGEEKLRSMIRFLPKNNSTKFAPIITSPTQLEAKMGQLVAFWQQQKESNKSSKVSIAL